MRAMFLWLAVFGTLLWAGDSAVIVQSGSTNSGGFRIVVEKSGKAAYTPLAAKSGRQTEQVKPQSKQIANDLAGRFYSDLGSAGPLAGLPKPRCMKSASFGTTLTVEMAGQKSPDLSCGDGGNAKLKALIQDTNEIVSLFSTGP
jgi:hypothetical protein